MTAPEGTTALSLLEEELKEKNAQHNADEQTIPAEDAGRQSILHLVSIANGPMYVGAVCPSVQLIKPDFMLRHLKMSYLGRKITMQLGKIKVKV